MDTQHPGAEHPCLVSKCWFIIAARSCFMTLQLQEERTEGEQKVRRGRGRERMVDGHKTIVRMSKSHCCIAQEGDSG